MVDKTWIKVLANKQMNLTEKLGVLSKIKETNEVVEGEQRKIQVVLDLTSSIDLAKNRLDDALRSIVSREK